MAVKAKLNAVENRKKSKESRGHNGKEKAPLSLVMKRLRPSGDGWNENRLGFEIQEHDVNENQSESAPKTRHRAARAKCQQKIIPTKKPMQKKIKKICEFCSRDFKTQGVTPFENHVRKCKKLHRFIKGENSNQCALCPENREFSTQGKVFVHLEKRHANQISQNDFDEDMAVVDEEIPRNDSGENRDGIIGQNDLDEDITSVDEKIEEISRKDSGVDAEVFEKRHASQISQNDFDEDMAIVDEEIPRNDYGENLDGTIGQNDLDEDIASVEKIEENSRKDSGVDAEV